MLRIEIEPTDRLPGAVPTLLVDLGPTVKVLVDRDASLEDACEAITLVLSSFARDCQRASRVA